MKILRIHSCYRRDCKADIECENCGDAVTIIAYDDRDFWDIGLPNRKCERCGKSSVELGSELDYIATRYPEGMTV